MNRRSTQFGSRENTASSRRHASRLAVDSHLKPMGVEEQIPHSARSPYPDDTSGTNMLDLMHAKSQSAGKYLRFEERALTDFIQRQRRA